MNGITIPIEELHKKHNYPKKTVKKIINDNKKFIKKLDKTMRNNPGYKKCEKFSKEKLKELIQKNKQLGKTLTKTQKVLMYNVFKQIYCNPKCYGTEGLNKKKYLKNGFITMYSEKEIKKLRRNGALSGCVIYIPPK